MHTTAATLLLIILASASAFSVEENFTLSAIHPNSQALGFEDPDEFDEMVKGFRRVELPRDKVIFVSSDPQFSISDVKGVSIGATIGGQKSIVIEFAATKKKELRELRLNLVTDRFVLMDSNSEVLGIVRTVSIGVDTCRFSVPVANFDDAQKLYRSLEALTKKPKQR